MFLINTEQREHLKLLRENSPDSKCNFSYFPNNNFNVSLFFLVAIEICKLTLDYLSNGANTNRYQTIASKCFRFDSIRSSSKITNFSSNRQNKHDMPNASRHHKCANYASIECHQNKCKNF